jgi:glycosyltransferase involved in cell wall biosynthesis
VVLARGGPAETVENGRSGLACGSLDGMAAAVVALAADPPLRERMAAAARTRAADFSVERFRRQFRAVAYSVLARPAEVTA